MLSSTIPSCLSSLLFAFTLSSFYSFFHFPFSFFLFLTHTESMKYPKALRTTTINFIPSYYPAKSLLSVVIVTAICKCLVSNYTNTCVNHFHPHEMVDRGSEAQLQVEKNKLDNLALQGLMKSRQADGGKKNI